MNSLFKIDIHEPAEYETMIAQVLGQDNVKRIPLNQAGYADYVFNWWSGELEQYERKQANEVLSALEDTEYQLAGEIFNHPEGRLGLIIEGVVIPAPTGIQTFKRAPSGKVFYRDRFFRYPYQRYERWKADLERQGVLIWCVDDSFGLVHALVALYASAQKEPTTLTRYLKVKGVLQPKPKDWDDKNPTLPWQPNPYVQQIIQTPDNGFGVELAQTAIDLYGTPWDLYRQQPELLASTIPGVSMIKARQFFKAIGKDV